MPLTLQEITDRPKQQRVLSCGHTGDIFSKEVTYKIDGEEVCQGCYFDKFPDSVGIGSCLGNCTDETKD